MSLRLRYLRLRAETGRGRFGADIPLADGLMVLRADNSRGKSTSVQSFLFALGLERMITARPTNAVTSAMRDRLIFDPETKGETPVLSSWVSLEIEGNDDSVATVTRWVKHDEIDAGLVRVVGGPALTAPGNYPSRDLYVGRAGAVANPRGFHRWLAPFIGWQLPELPAADGRLSPLYMEQVFPLLFVEQRRGWGGIQAQMPYFAGVSDAMKERGLRSPWASPERCSGVLTPSTTKEAPVSEQYADRQIVGIDLHRRRTVIVRMTPAGEKLETVRIDNDPVALGLEIAKAGPDPDVVLEATYGWYWAVDVLQDAGAQVHLAHPLGVKGFAYRRVKNDARDAADLADLLRMGRLPEAWIAPRPVRELREQVRHRAKLVALRSGLKAQVHAVLAKQGVPVPMSDLFGVGGSKLLDRLGLDAPYAARVGSLRRIIDLLDFEIDVVSKRVAVQLAGHDGYRAIQAVPGIGPVLAAVFVAEIGDVTRFRTPAQLACWAGLTPRHRESDTTVHRGPITKQGSRLVRWAAIEAVQRTPGTAGWLVATRAELTHRRGRNIATVAVARRLLALVFYGLRDGHIRAFDHGDRRGADATRAA